MHRARVSAAAKRAKTAVFSPKTRQSARHKYATEKERPNALFFGELAQKVREYVELSFVQAGKHGNQLARLHLVFLALVFGKKVRQRNTEKLTDFLYRFERRRPSRVAAGVFLPLIHGRGNFRFLHQGVHAHMLFFEQLLHTRHYPLSVHCSFSVIYYFNRYSARVLNALYYLFTVQLHQAQKNSRLQKKASARALACQLCRIAD